MREQLKPADMVKFLVETPQVSQFLKLLLHGKELQRELEQSEKVVSNSDQMALAVLALVTTLVED
jgi:hypothetical protein